MVGLLGLIVLVTAIALLRWYSVADVKTIKRGLAWIGICLLGLVAVFLALTGRFGAALAALAGLSVWASRLVNIFQLGRHLWGGAFSRGPSGPQGPHQGANQAEPPSTMTAEEAYRILGLAPGADVEAIKTAYRRLIEQIHPDRGGSDYLAAKVNQAKDFLLKNQRRT